MQPFFLEVGGGNRFFVHFPATEPARESPAVVYVPPFAEEMNKCRHMAAMAARAMSASGVAVLMPDLYGCGDSSGGFGEANWEDWHDDILRAVDWLGDAGHQRVALWGVRLGALLAAAVGNQIQGRVDRYLFWQPILSGELAISQFLRLKVAGDMLSSASASASLADARAALASGKTIEVAGYELTPSMVNSISGQRLGDMTPGCPVQWLEVAADPSRGLGHASSRIVDGWRELGVKVDEAVVLGQPFWNAGNNEDVVDCLPLLTATDEATQAW